MSILILVLAGVAAVLSGIELARTKSLLAAACLSGFSGLFLLLLAPHLR